MLLTGRAPDHVTRPDFRDRAFPALHQTASRCHDQGLAQRMGVPRGPGAGLERDADAERARAGSFAWNSESIRTLPAKDSAGPLLEGCEPLLLMSIL
jgi:hypothetical protein